MSVVHIVLNVLLFLGGSVWLGGLVMLAVATTLIGATMPRRRTEGRQLVRRLRGVFQRVELIALAGVWTSNVALLVLEQVLGEGFPGTWGPADGFRLGVLIVPTLAALYSTLYLTPAIARQEQRLGAYTDRNQQVAVRKKIALLHAQAKALVWVNAVLVAALVASAVVAMD